MKQKDNFQRIGYLEQLQNVPKRVGCYPKYHKAFTYLTSQSYATFNEEPRKGEKKEGFDKSEQDADEIRKIILGGNLNQLDKKEFLENNALANELFKTGILKKEISPCELQERFRQSCQGDKIIFFPTGLTTKIFKTILETKRENPFYLTCQKGVGKSFSAALLVVLLRRNPSKRVFYLNNSEDFCRTANYYFVQELKRAFYEELQDDMELDRELKRLSSLHTEEVGRAITNFMTKIGEVLKKKQKELFIIIDQVNLLEKPTSRETSSGKLAFGLYKFLKAYYITETTRVFICSPTNEESARFASQEYPLITLEPVYPTTEEATKFISIRSGGSIKDEDQINKILQSTSRYLLMTNEVLVSCNNKKLDESLINYQTKKLLSITTDLRKFFEPNLYVNQDLVDRRKVAMTTVLYTLLSQEEDATDGSKFWKVFEEQEIDQRYFIYDIGKLSVRAINPLAISGLRETLDDLSLLKQAIPYLTNNAAGLGKLFEDLILKHLPECKIPQAYPLIPFLDDDRDAKLEINFSKFVYCKFKTQEVFDFSTPGMLRVPDITVFAAFDGFLVTHTDVFALQVKKRDEKEKLAPLIEFLKKAAEKERSTEEDKPKSGLSLSEGLRKSTVFNNVQRVIKSAEEANKTLGILLISISQDPRNDTAFEGFKENLPFKCYYLDARQGLIDLGCHLRYLD